MKVQNYTNMYNSQYINKQPTITIPDNITTKTSNLKNMPNYGIHSVPFKGLFGVSLKDKLEYGLQALDENSILVVTDEKSIENSNAILKQSADKIDSPISKVYTINISEKELGKKNNCLDNQFAIFKNKQGFNVLPLNFSIYVDHGKNSGYDKNNRVNIGNSKLLKDDDKIKLLTGDSWDNDIYFTFKTPKKYDPEPAQKYLDYKAINTTPDEIAKFNKSSIGKILNTDKTENNKQELTFKDIGGLDKQIQQLRASVLRPLNYPEVYNPIRLNKGILLYGPPRCGKTMLGKALANEAGVDFKYMNANEFKTAKVGGSEEMVRDTFSQLETKPTILFIDEFDAVAKKRDGSSNARYDDAVVNQLLGCMSDLEKSKTNSFVIAATNRLDLIDEAMKDSGRLGLHIEIPLPDKDALGDIYDIYSKNIPLEGNNEKKSNFKESCCNIMATDKFNGSDVAEMFSIAYMNSLERLGMNEKMDNGTFMPSDLKNIKVSQCDMLQAIKQIEDMKKENKKRTDE